MADFSNDIATTNEMISEDGGLFTFRSTSASSTETDKPWRVTSESNDDQKCYAIIFPEGGKTNIYISTEGLTGRLDESMLIIDPSNNQWTFKPDTLKALEPAADGQLILYTGELDRWPT